jgi:hypothetical protein
MLVIQPGNSIFVFPPKKRGAKKCLSYRGERLEGPDLLPTKIIGKKVFVKVNGTFGCWVWQSN